MANPNIISTTAIYGNTSSIFVTSNSSPFATALVSNPASSGKVFKINSIVVSTLSEVVERVTIGIFSEDDLGGTSTHLVSNVALPVSASLIVTDKNTSFYLLEDKSIGVSVSTANVVYVTTSWEEIQ